MGLFGRLRERVREWFGVTPPPPSPPPPAPPGGPDDEPEDFPRPPQDLPPGWAFEGLYYGDRPPPDRRVINQHPSDYDIGTADDVIVSYTDSLGTIYRTIHGANSRKGVGKLILMVTMNVSPR